MTQISYRCNLATKAFPFIPARKPRTTIIPGPDQVYNRYRSPAETVVDVGTPEVMYVENVLPAADGYRSVAMKQLSTGALSAGFVATKLTSVHYLGAPYLIIEAANYTTGANENWRYDPVTNLIDSITGNVVTANYSVNAVSYARINATTYVYLRSTFAGTFNSFDGHDYINIVPAGLSLANTLGILASNGYCIAYSATGIAWSSTTDPTDFVPSLITGAGGGDVQEVEGQILFARSTSFGFILYCTNNCVSAVYTGNSRSPFKFTAIAGAGGGLNSELVASAPTENFQYAITTNGLQLLSVTGARNILPEFADFILEKYKETFDKTTYTFTSRISGNSYVGKFTLVGNRYFCYSYGLPTFANAPDDLVYNYCLVYDLILERWGQIKFDHVDICDNKQITTLESAIDDIAVVSYKGLKFLTQSGDIYYPSLSTQDLANPSIIILGRYQYARSHRLVLDEVVVDNDLNNIGFVSDIDVVDLPSQDGRTLGNPVVGSLGSSNLLSKQFFFEQDAVNHCIVISGTFYITTVQLKFHLGGRL